MHCLQQLPRMDIWSFGISSEIARSSKVCLVSSYIYIYIYRSMYTRVWNLERDFKAHERAVNRICWHPTDPNLLLSASQDGLIKLWVIIIDEYEYSARQSSEDNKTISRFAVYTISWSNVMIIFRIYVCYRTNAPRENTYARISSKRRRACEMWNLHRMVNLNLRLHLKMEQSR